MKHTLLGGILAASLAVLSPATAQQEAATPAADAPAADAPAAPVDPATVKKDSSYGFGFREGRQFASQVSQYGINPSDIDQEAFLKGFMTGFGGNDPEVEESKLQAAMQALGTLLQSREKDVAAKNLEAGKKFLAENGKRKEVTTTKSGLQYEVLKPGGDRKYKAPADGSPDNQQFLVNYRGTLIDGTEFDASPAGQPVPMTLGVIDGFKEALTSMPVGAKWKLFIPANLAYGEQRRSNEIAPNTTLIFELELVDIQAAPAAPSAQTPPIQIPPPADK